MKQRGFTLIELLVVIAIIGILSAVVLASLNTAREQGEDATIQSELSSMRSEAELYYTQNSNEYSNVCDADSGDASPGALYDSVVDSALNGNADCNDSADEWAAWAQLSTDNYFCVDYTGYSDDTGKTSVDDDSATDCETAFAL